MSKHEVVISGLAGTFPECSNVKLFEELMLKKENLVTESPAKWKLGALNVPAFSGKVKDPYLFDQTYFGIHRKLCLVMDTHARVSIEKSYEALCDAGINPLDVNGAKVAVLMSTMTSETEYGSVMVSKHSGHAMLGHSRSMQANRISYFFNFKGPSFSLDCSWIGPLQAVEIAAGLVARGHVKMAVVGASNLSAYPELSYHYESLKKLNPEGKTKSFSADAEGYNRSEGIVVFVLQRAEDALRSYGSIVKVKCTTEMNHQTVFADAVGFDRFIGDFYSDVDINKSEIAYIEGDGSASLNMDAMELNGVVDALCHGRKKPLLVGSCKTKLGHCESSAAFMSILNALIAFKTGFIPPTIHYSSPNPLVPGLKDGRIKVVTEKTPLEGDYIGVTAIGLASIYAHILLKRNPNTNPITDESYFPPDGIPRLFLLSGRDEDVMKKILANVLATTPDNNYYSLNHNLFKTNFPKHLFRGYSIVSEKKKSSKVISYPGGSKRPVWFIFSGMGSQWNEMGKGLFKIPVINKAIKKCHKALLPKGIDLISIVTTTDPTIYDNILHAFVGIAAIQIGLVDLLEELGIEADGMVGHSVGELGCSYGDKCLTAEQVILAAYARGKASNDATLIKGMMAAVGKSYSQIKDELPEGIEVACHNSNSSCTLSGPADTMKTYVEELKAKGVFARLVNVANIAYHSKNIAPAAPFLLKYLKKIIPEPKPRSSKWVSSSVPEDKWDTDLAKYCSAEYHTNNLLSYVLFEEATAHVPKDAICIEIAPHGLLQAIVKKSLSTCTHIPLTNRSQGEDCFFLLEALGNLFTNGVQLDMNKLYPPIEYPVSRETDYLNVITWDHNEVWIPLALQYEVCPKLEDNCWKDLILPSYEEKAIALTSIHRIRGNTFYPKAKLLVNMMGYLKKHAELSSIKFKCYAFHNIKFHQDLPYDMKEDIHVHVLFQRGTGAFEILFNKETITTGQLTHTITPLPTPCLDSEFAAKQENQTFVSENHIYDYFETNDCIFKGPYRNITSITIFEGGFSGKIKWRQCSELYLDALFKLLVFYSSIQTDLMMDLDEIFEFLYDSNELPNHDQDIDVYFDKNIGCLIAQGVRILLYKTKPISHNITDSLDLKNRQFLPYSKVDPKLEIDFAELCLQVFNENGESKKLQYHYILDESSEFCKDIAGRINKDDLLASYNITLRPRNSVSEMSLEKDAKDNYLIISENYYYDGINKLMKNNTSFYFIYTGSDDNLQKRVSMKQLTPIIEQKVNGKRVVVYKQKRTNFDHGVFVELSPESFSKDIQSLTDVASETVHFIVCRYSLLSDVISILQSTKKIFLKNKRLFFIDESSPKFNPNSSFYSEQLAKDLKINVAVKGVWGSLIDNNITGLTNIVEHDIAMTIPLNFVSCKTVDLKVLGLNLQSLVLPKKYTKLSLVEFAGILDDEQVFGLGKLTEDNYLEVDPHLCWKKPSEWTMEEAATVPFYYCMAYDFLYVKGHCSNRPNNSVLIHAGHSPFAQAVITVAVAMKITVHTTCFTLRQKQFILRKFPQVNESNVYIISENRNSFVNGILNQSEGDGPKIIIDTLEQTDLRNQTLQCTGNLGSYYLVTNNDMDSSHAFGMNIFLRETAIFGYNPQLLLDTKEAEKIRLNGLLSSGLKANVIKPLERISLDKQLSQSEAVNVVVSKSQEEIPKKIIMPVQKPKNTDSGIVPSNENVHKKNYMIVGTHNNLWFDLLKWLVSRGVDSIHVVLNQDQVPQYLKKRFSNFIAKHKYISVIFSGTENLNTAQNCTQFIKAFQNGSRIDTVFYIKPGFEKQISNIDYALRLNSKKSCLVAIGLQACRITEKRQNDGFRGVSFILMKNNLRNCMVLNALDNWYKKCDESEDVILVDKAKTNKEMNRLEKYADFLPSSGYELVDLCRNISDKPCFVEVSTMCPTDEDARDLNPIFLFPGLKVSLLQKFTSKLMYPTYMAKYPLVISSLNDIAVPFAETLIKTFDYRIFTLIAEGWSGPLVLMITKILEERGIVSEVILLDGVPENVQQWNSLFDRSNNIISKYVPTINEGQTISIDNLKSWSSKISKIIAKEDRDNLMEDEVHQGFETLINRLDTLKDFSSRNQTLESTVHLFTSCTLDNEITDLKKMCSTSFYHHDYESSKHLLEIPFVIKDVNNLPLVEYKMRAAKQVVKDIATLNLIGEKASNMYNLEGFEVVSIGR